ncbi:hypothetical protein G4234_00365 [Serratia marcescens]|uniref:hypothetical protein n=1 Tax=Serratia marcescens TaxID=615 RepID=UPI001419FDCA|nr:hypothetical protein [Serratia marcescens]NIA32176.1 hypothetical protein [Serratia marcescens]
MTFHKTTICLLSLIINPALSYNPWDITSLNDANYKEAHATAIVNPNSAKVQEYRVAGILGQSLTNFGGTSMLYVNNWKSGGNSTIYEKHPAPCFPSVGPGDVRTAIQQWINSNIVNLEVPYLREGSISSAKGVAVIMSIYTCSDSRIRFITSNESNPQTTPPISCSIEGPGTVILDPSKPLRSIPYDLVCMGTGSSRVRISVVGNDEINPTPGLTLYTRGPTQPFPVTGSSTTPFIIDFGMTSHSVAPGTYNGTFVYQVEYI